MSAESASRAPSRLWWGYFALLLAMAAVGLYATVLTGLKESTLAVVINVVSFLFDTICIIGLYGYIRSRSYVKPLFWRSVLTLLIAKLLLSASFLAPNLFPIDGTLEHFVALLGLGGLLLALPLVIALWFYAMRSPHLWERDGNAI